MYLLNRTAMAMIELIFAIVVMGIVMLSAPMLISTAANSTSVALQQEGIHESAARVNMILTYAWDENDTNTTVCGNTIPPILRVTGGDSELDPVGTTARRLGVDTNSSSHTFKCGTLELNATAIGSEGGDQDDMDDFANTSLILNTSGSGGKDYIEQDAVQVATTISYTSDVASYQGGPTVSYNFDPSSGVAGTTTNIKAITVTLTSTSSVSELQKTIVLNAFACNVGGFEYESRTMP